MVGREIKRSQYLRGTQAFRARNWFIFTAMTSSILSGLAMIYFFNDDMTRLYNKLEKNKEWKQERQDRLKEIYQRHAAETAVDGKE